MGYFSYECKGCDQDLTEGEEVRLNGCKGVYDGYGGAGGFDAGNAYHEPVAWHEKCYYEATDAEKLDEAPSRNARNQGCGFARADCMPEETWGVYQEPPRLPFKDVSSVDVRVYLEALYADDMDRKDGRTPYWFNAAPNVRLADEGEPELFAPSDLTTGDYAETYEAFGNRWDHNWFDPEYLPGGRKARGGEYWGETAEDRERNDPGDMFWAMLDRFQGKHEAVSTIAHAILSRATRRMRADK